jgi:FkbM family methyltransferase
MLLSRVMNAVRTEGIAGLAARVKDRLVRSSEGTHSATTVTHEAAMEWFGRRQGEYERLISAVQPYIRPDGVIFDVGANVGYFTDLLTRRTAFRGSAFLFEPVRHLAELCRQTCRDAPFEVTVLDYGLSDRETEKDIFIAGDGNIGWNTLITDKATPDMTPLRIQLRPFDGCGIDATPTFIKIDVEGAEHQVLKGMLGSFRTWQPLPVVLCEVAWGQSHPNWSEEVRMFEELKALGYSFHDLDGARLDEKKLDGTTDVLFLPMRDPGE